MTNTATKDAEEAVTSAVKKPGKASKSSKTALGGESLAFAVIKTGGKQYKVSEGDTVKIEIMNGDYKVGDKLEFGEVLLNETGSDTKIGAPFIAGAKVTGEIVQIDRDPKIVVLRYKQKNRSGSTKNGHRQCYFKVKISSIVA